MGTSERGREENLVMNKVMVIAILFLAYVSVWAGAQEDDLINLARSGIEEEVLIIYIDAAKGPYHLTTSQIVELRDLGVSSKVISEALKHGSPENEAVAPGSNQVTASAADTIESPMGSIASPLPPVAKSSESTSVIPVTPPPETLVPMASSSEAISPAVPPPLNATESASVASIASQPSEMGAPTASPPEAVASAVPSAEVVAPVPDDQNISFFYQALYPYGTWISVDGQWCWRPNAASLDLNWTPYCSNGYWAYTDWGWFWVSNYTWGWAPFHYGRWFRYAGYGWVWMPGTEWGPAWVSFRSGDGYFGWAPLPPAAHFVDHRGFFFNGRLAVGGIGFGLTMTDYRFVPAAHFLDRDLWLHSVSPDRVQEFFGRTTIMRDNYRIFKGWIFNRGPSVEMVSRSTGRPITQLTIESNQLRPGERIRGIISSNRSLVVYKPMIAQDAPKSPLDIEKHYEQGRSNGGAGGEARVYDQGGRQQGQQARPYGEERQRDRR